MREDFLKSLQCPDCTRDISIVNLYTRTNQEIVNAIVRCDCSEYPLIDGILLYKKPSSFDRLSNTAYICDRLRGGHINHAKALSIKSGGIENSLLNLHMFLSSLGPFTRSISPILTIARKKKIMFYNKMLSSLSFFDIVDIIEPNIWGDYLKHRFSSQTLWSIYPFIPLIQKKRDMVLDLGCGAGHASFILSKSVNPNNITCADENYTMLFLAKKYMVNNANFICLDANNPLPFPDDHFSSIIMMDSLHYVSNRAQLAKENERILTHKGLILLTHLHNGLRKNVSKGFPLPPKVWKALFKDLDSYIIPERFLIEDFIFKNELDLTKKYDDADINSSGALSMVLTKDDKLLSKYGNLNRYLDKVRYPIINPIYEVAQKKDEIHLQRNPPNDLFLSEYPLSKKFLVNSYIVPKEISKTIKDRKVGIPIEAQQRNKTFTDMVRKFIIIDSPKGYV